MRPEEFLKQSDFLLSLKYEEVNCRSAVSRAYYALYHEAKNYLEGNHNRIYKEIEQKAIKEKGKLKPNYHLVVADVLARLNKGYRFDFIGFRDKRTEADYYLNNSFLTQQDAKDTIDEINKFIVKVKSL